MGIIIVDYKLTKQDLDASREDYPEYITKNTFEVNAILNLKPDSNDSLEILDPKTRNHFLEVVKRKLPNIQSLV